MRAALASSGLNHGPISVRDTMIALGMHAPSPASLARIFREKNVARSKPTRKPRASSVLVIILDALGARFVEASAVVYDENELPYYLVRKLLSRKIGP